MNLRKVCRICKQEKDVSEFRLRKEKNKVGNYRTECKTCTTDYKKKNYEENKDLILKKRKESCQKNREEVLLRKKNYYWKNREVLNKKAKKCYKKNREKIIKRASEWNRTNKERRSEICKISGKRNSHTSAANLAKRRFSKKQASPMWSETYKIKIVYKKAKELSLLLGVDMQVDHVIPLRSDNVCGLHVWANLQILEKSINIAKSNKVLV